jgi:hypothetical protein
MNIVHLNCVVLTSPCNIQYSNPSLWRYDFVLLLLLTVPVTAQSDTEVFHSYKAVEASLCYRAEVRNSVSEEGLCVYALPKCKQGSQYSQYQLLK